MSPEPDNKNVLKAYNLLLYFAGSMIMNEPTEECIVDFWTSGKLKELPITSSNPRFILAASTLRESCQDTTMCKQKIADDFFRLFEVKGSPLAPAYASVYLARNSFTAEQNESVGNFYRTYGWTIGFTDRVAEDHLGIELLFLTRLVEKYLLLEDEPCHNVMKKDIRRFIDQHLLTWVPSWNEDIQEYSRTHCYKGIGTLIHASIEDLYGILSSNNPL
jgi:TorA maturation chaperone TorD